MKPVKWKKCLVFILFVISILFSSSASGHSGRTDGKGGHYDRSTGEYHYHHGYPAHDHYDMDGDGTIDCPYDFDDQTNYDYGRTYKRSSTQESSKPTKPYSKKTDNQASSLTSLESDQLDESIDWGLILFLIVVSIYPLYCLYQIIKNYINKISERKKHEQWVSQERQRKFEEEKAEYTALYGGRSIYEIIDAPSDSEIGRDGLPKNIGAKGWGTRYTFYTSANGNCYHTSNCRYTNLNYKKNAYFLKHSRYYPCSICKPVLPDVSWVDEYKKIIWIKKEYGIDICIPET